MVYYFWDRYLREKIKDNLEIPTVIRILKWGKIEKNNNNGIGQIADYQKRTENTLGY